MKVLLKSLPRFTAAVVSLAKDHKSSRSNVAACCVAWLTFLVLNVSTAWAQAATLTTLYSFAGGSDGATPTAALALGSDGDFYGTASEGGAGGYGIVFKIKSSGGALTILHTFGGVTDGSRPSAPLVLGSDGYFYGTTFSGGSSNAGTAFKMSSSGVLTTLHSFNDAADGANPVAALTQGADGNYYGVTSSGGAQGFGTIFQLSPTGQYKTLHHFNGSIDGLYPNAALALADDGLFYEVTSGGGRDGCGTFSRISKNGTFDLLYTFPCGAEQNPLGLVKVSNNSFYGFTNPGVGGGLMFKITTAGDVTPLQSFNYSELPWVTPVLGFDGNFYGVSRQGGQTGCGTVLAVSPSGTSKKSLYTFSCDGGEPVYPRSVIQGPDLNLYGTADSPAGGHGAIFKLALPQVAKPTFSPAGGTYNSIQSVTLGTSTNGATIHYTTDGTTPTVASAVYGAPLTVSNSMTIKAVAIELGYLKSAVSSATYTIQAPAATPTFSLAAGTYTGTQTVTISDATSGATIRYTTDGSTPTSGSTLYSGPISIAKTTTLKAIALASGYANSAVATATYTIQAPAATPTFSLAAGTYTGTQTVTISDATSGATIRYTTDGSTPTASSTLYSGPVSISKTTTLKAIAMASGYADSAVASATYTIQTRAATPTFNPAGGTYNSAQSVTISDSTSGATIRYTTDGSTPTAASTPYSGPISVTKTMALKAIAVASGYADSAVATASYTIQTPTATPTFNPGSGTYTGSQSVTISDGTAGASIYYTTDGSTPTTSSSKYSGPIAVSSSTTLKAIATASGYSTSAVSSATYTIQSQAATPAFSPAGGTYTGTQSITITDGTAGAIIRYTTDGSTPTVSSTQYTGPISVSSSMTIKAIAIASGYANSSVASASYTILVPAATPTFSPAGGTYTGSQTVTLSDATSGATIRYTTDGSTPTATSTPYSGPITISNTTTIKAIAIASGYANSAVASATYTILMPAATPTFSLASGTYKGVQSVTISDSTNGATIRYTIDGTTPTASSAQYTGPLSVSSSMTIKAIATASGYANSAVASATYNIEAASGSGDSSGGGGATSPALLGLFAVGALLRRSGIGSRRNSKRHQRAA